MKKYRRRIVGVTAGLVLGWVAQGYWQTWEAAATAQNAPAAQHAPDAPATPAAAAPDAVVTQDGPSSHTQTTGRDTGPDTGRDTGPAATPRPPQASANGATNAASPHAAATDDKPTHPPAAGAEHLVPGLQDVAWFQCLAGGAAGLFLAAVVLGRLASRFEDRPPASHDDDHHHDEKENHGHAPQPATHGHGKGH